MGLSQIGPQVLNRTPEPNSITSSAEQITQYDEVLKTKLVIAYALALETIYKSLPEQLDISQRTAIDLACGPGHFSLSLIRYLYISRLRGFDLSPGMVSTAANTAKSLFPMQGARFEVQDVRDLRTVASGQTFLSTFTDAAHHMTSLSDVTSVFREMERITHPKGLIFAMDLVRLRTEKLTHTYIDVLGQDYLQLGLPAFKDDFRYSMFAAWTTDELRSAVPKDSERVWYHLIPRFLPTVQILIGLPIGREKLFIRSGVPWDSKNNPVPDRMKTEAFLARLSLLRGYKHKIVSRESMQRHRIST